MTESVYQIGKRVGKTPSGGVARFRTFVSGRLTYCLAEVDGMVFGSAPTFDRTETERWASEKWADMKITD
jgi:hypothetical protein